MIEEDIKLIKGSVQHLIEEVYTIKKMLLPKEFDNSSTRDNFTMENKMMGNYPRFCRCGKKLGKNKTIGKCDPCIKKFASMSVIPEKGEQ